MIVVGLKTTMSAFRPGAKDAAVFDAHALRGKRGHLSDRVLQREHVLLAHVHAEHARECAVSAWVGRVLPERRHPRRAVRRDHRRGMFHDAHAGRPR